MIHHALVEIRLLGWAGKAEQAADLADAFHNLPTAMYQDDFSLWSLRDDFLAPYQQQYPFRQVWNFVTLVDGILAMRD